MWNGYFIASSQILGIQQDYQQQHQHQKQYPVNLLQCLRAASKATTEMHEIMPKRFRHQ
jgi:hypothetical protein